MKIGGMNNPFLKPNGVNPFNKVAQTQNQNQEQNKVQDQQPDQNKTQQLKPEEQDEQMKKYSKAWSSYGIAQLALNSSSKPGLGVETCGTMG